MNLTALQTKSTARRRPRQKMLAAALSDPDRKPAYAYKTRSAIQSLNRLERTQHHRFEAYLSKWASHFETLQR